MTVKQETGDEMDDFERMLEEMQQFTREEIKKSNIQIDKVKLNNFKNIIAELVSIRNENADKMSQFQTSTEKDIVKVEYSKGGETIHRGYYCPSPVLDLIVGNLNRGKILKKKPDFLKYAYEYGFDNENRLVKVKKVNKVNEFTPPVIRFDEEYLVYKKDIVYAIEFDNMGEINVVSRCTYENGNIVKYEHCGCGLEEYANLYYEEYLYESGILSEVNLFDVTPQIELYTEQRYKVEVDEVGKISTLIGGFITNGIWEQDAFNFKK
jgi:hypothetical protein